MPRKKKPRKHRKNKHTKFDGNPPTAHSSNNMADTLGGEENAQYSTPKGPLRTRKDSFELDTPARKLQVEVELLS